MGTLHYAGKSFAMEDRVLAHLQVVIGMKLRRGENFFINWRNTASDGGGRNSIWIDNGVPIFCEFDGGRIPSINRDWIETLAASAGTNFGLQITEEGGIVPLNTPGDER